MNEFIKDRQNSSSRLQLTAHISTMLGRFLGSTAQQLTHMLHNLSRYGSLHVTGFDGLSPEAMAIMTCPS
jgi:hypothetical protein